MSIVDRVNRMILKRIGRNDAPIRVDGDEIRVGRESVALVDLSSIVAHEVDVHAGTANALTLSLGGGRTLTTTQEDPGWDALVAALDRLELTAVPSWDWIVALMAGGAEVRPIVLRRDRRPSS